MSVVLLAGIVKVMDHKREDPNRKWKVDIEKNTQDILGTFMFFKHHKWIDMNNKFNTTIYNNSTLEQLKQLVLNEISNLPR